MKKMNAPKPKPPEALLADRGKSHGEFRNNSKVSQAIKEVFHSNSRWYKLPAYKKEGLEMIAHKIGRLLEGNDLFQDHWDDIVGYAKLMADRNAQDVADINQMNFELTTTVNKT